MTQLNQHVNSVSLQLTEVERRVKDELSATLQAAEAGAARETELVANCENQQKQFEMANSKVLEMAGESEQLGHERLSIISEYKGRKGQLKLGL